MLKGQKVRGADGCRLHLRFKGVPDDRPGGPWWSRTFYSSVYKSAATKRKELLEALLPFLEAAYYSESDDPCVGDAPPDGALAIEVELR